jgi:hypothetical protein
MENNIDISTLVELVMDRFYSADGYTELSEKNLKGKIRKYLESEYRKELNISSMKLSVQKESKGFVNKDSYEMEYKRIEYHMIELTKMLAASDKEDLQDFI